MLMPVQIVVNGVAADVVAQSTVAELVTRYCPSPRGVAVARNGDVVPRSAWSSTALSAGDRLEILTAAAGG